jgi:hypothetical protein
MFLPTYVSWDLRLPVSSFELSSVAILAQEEALEGLRNAVAGPRRNDEYQRRGPGTRGWVRRGIHERRTREVSRWGAVSGPPVRRSVEFRRQFPADPLRRYYYHNGNPREYCVPPKGQGQSTTQGKVTMPKWGSKRTRPQAGGTYAVREVEGRQTKVGQTTMQGGT